MQTIIIIVLIIIAISLFNFFRDRDKALTANVDAKGGMMQKYNTVVQAFLNDPHAKISKLDRDQIIISRVTTDSNESFIITETFNEVQVSWIAKIRNKQYSKKWEFANYTDPQEILDTILDYLSLQSMYIN